MPKYICFRYYIVPIEAHLFTKPVSDDVKLTWFRESFLINQDFQSKSGSEFAVRITENEDSFWFGKLSRKIIYPIHEKHPDDIKEFPVDDWPYLDFLCTLEPQTQLLIINYNSSIIKDVSSLSKLLEDITSPSLFVKGYSVSFLPIVTSTAFWDYVEQASGIFKLTLDLKSPNIFNANQKANDSLKTLRNLFNNNSMRISLTNDKGELSVPHEIVDSYRDYADKGGGNWELVINLGDNKKKRKVRSSDKAVRITVDYDTVNRTPILKIALQQFLSML